MNFYKYKYKFVATLLDIFVFLSHIIFTSNYFIDTARCNEFSEGNLYNKANNLLCEIIETELRISEWVMVKGINKVEIFKSCVDQTNTDIFLDNINKVRKALAKECMQTLFNIIENKRKGITHGKIMLRKGNDINYCVSRFCINASDKFLKKRKAVEQEAKDIPKIELYEGSIKSEDSTKSIQEDKKENIMAYDKASVQKILYLIFSDYKYSLFNTPQLISQIRRKKQKQVKDLIRKHNLKGLSVFLSNESPEDMFSFLDALVSSDKSKKNFRRSNYNQLKSLFGLDSSLGEKSEESLPFGSIPTFEDEWNAILEWIENQSINYKFDTNWMIRKRDGVFKKPIIKGDFEPSRGFEDKFVSQCINLLRPLAYKVHVAPNGDKYYSYNPNNQYGLIIEGRNQYERTKNLKNACKTVFNKYYEYLGINTIKEDDEFKFKLTGKLNFIAPLNHDKKILNKLVKSLYNLINDRKREWMAIVYEAKISPLVNSQDLPLEIVPYYFSDESIRKETNLEKKESILSDKCFETLNKLRNERVPGEPDIKPYNIELGSEGIVSQAKFCKGVFERFILRHIEWLKLVIRSIGHEHIKLIDIEDPYLDIPDVFLFPEDARLEENCISTLLIVFEKNIQALENGFPVKVYPQMDYMGDPKRMVENITSFCKPNSIKKGKLNNSREIKSTIDTELSSENYSTESKLIGLIRESPVQNPLINIIVNIDDRFNKAPYENQHLDTRRLEKWKAHFEDSSLDSHGNSIINILKSQFADLVNYELNCEKKIRRYINSMNSRGVEKSNNIFLENYLMETDKLKEDWANEIQSIEDLRNNIRTAEGELENYVDVVKFTIQGDDKQKELPQYKKISREWQAELSNKERVYLKMKIDSLLLLQKHESVIENLRYEHLERRKKLKSDIKKMREEDGPIIIDLEYCSREDEDLYPVYPDFESKEEEDSRIEKMRNIDKALSEFKNRFIILNSKLNEQLVGINSFLTKVQNDFHVAWAESYNTALALQLQIRARALVEEYVRASERYLLLKRVKADYEYRKSLINEFQTDPSFEAMLSRASEMISKAEVEESELKNELKRLNDEKNKLPQIVEKDMQEIYSNRIKFIRNSKNILKKSIEQEKKYLNLEEKIFEDQLKRDLEYYKISDISESAIYRAEQLQTLYEATGWILNFNEKLTISHEIQHREDLEKLDYVVTRPALSCDMNGKSYTTEELFSNLRKYKYKYNENVDSLDVMSENELKAEKEKFCSEDPTKGEIPIEAQTILRMFKEKLLNKLNELDEINQLLLQLNLNTVGSFQYYDYNRVKAYTSFIELPYKKAFSNILAVILSHFEWEHIQLRWRVIQMMKHVLEEKEKLLSEISQMRSSLDLKMRKFDAIPLSRKLVPIGTLAAMDSVMNEIINGSKKTGEDESFEYLPSVIPHYLLSDDDYHKVRQYDESAKKIILNRILMAISTTEGQIVDLIKETKDNYEKKKLSIELEILSIKNDHDELKKTIGYKSLSQEEKDKEEKNIKDKINKLMESSVLIPLIARRDILIRKVDKIQLFTKKIQILFQDPSFTAEKAKELELAVFEFYGSESRKKYDEISPRINLAIEIYKLHDIENQINKIEELLPTERKDQQNISKLHRLKMEREEVNKKIKELKNEIDEVTEKINKFQEEKFRMIFEID
ncbi:hypothetical protein FG386_000031 [Cryptosporidium ryanae]|uniref:uncharacterized protein n=1 Tax=Cryptosporidium ryanae TaxID=515981 RepID=UPI003519FABE|nr:hypothetical protein FG386_000031 [Cryptosporidium ryanae]